MKYVMKLDERMEYELPDGSRITLAEIVALREAPPEDAGCETCAEVYQVVGHVWYETGNDAYVRVLDNLSASANGDKPPHDDILPFNPIDSKRAELVRWIDEWDDAPLVDCEDTYKLIMDIRDYLEVK